MWKCPKCGRQNKEDWICLDCGFDESRNFAKYRTVVGLTFRYYPQDIVQQTRQNIPWQLEGSGQPVKADIEVGDVIRFGAYWQDKNGTEKTPIEWVVLVREENRILVISRYGLDCQSYHRRNEKITWEKSSLRKWLNEQFLNDAFTDAEKKAIIMSRISNGQQTIDPQFKTVGGNDTIDSIFLLSYKEAKSYFKSDSERKGEATPYAKKQGAYVPDRDGWWWLRSPGLVQDFVTIVYTNGSFGYYGASRTSGCVRPALWIDLKAFRHYMEDILQHYFQNIFRFERQTPPRQQPEPVQLVRSDVKVGDVIPFGSYWQDTNGTEKTPVEWIVLGRKGNRIFVISRYGLDCQPYHQKNEKITWEKSSLRKWLNGHFLNDAFTDAEKKAIVLSRISNGKETTYSYWNTVGGNDTEDSIFLLSFQEAKSYFKSGNKQIVEVTPYAKKQGAYIHDNNGWWWLRSPGFMQFSAACVGADGSFDNSSSVDRTSGCVRPALWIDLSISNQGTVL